MFYELIMQNPLSLFMGTTALCGTAGLYLVHQNRQLRHSCQHSEEIISALQEGFYRSSLDGKQLSANPALVRMNGYKSEQELLDAVNDIASEWYVDPGRRAEFEELLFANGKVTNFVSEIYRHKSRERIWISENARLVYDPVSMEPLHYEGTVREITDEVRHRQTQDRLNKLAENLQGGLFQIRRDANGKFSTPYLSNSFIKLMEIDFDATRGSPNQYLKYIHPEDLTDYLLAFSRSAETLEPVDRQIRYIGGEGNAVKWLHVTATPEQEDDGSIVWHGHVSDITEQKLVEQKFERLAYVDGLTGLPKRAVLEDKLLATIRQCNRRNSHAALLFIDLDNFKQLNDTRGHDIGDELLCQVADRLKLAVRTSDTVSRFGGDEFVILIDGLEGEEKDALFNAKLFGDKILGAFRQPFDLGGQDHAASPSIGIALIGPDLPGAEEIARQADSAMYSAKKKGRNTCVVFGEGNSPVQQDLSGLQSDLSSALAKEQFELLYQPQFTAGGDLAGAEAFIRWHHPEHGTLIPPDFMPLAERNGVITQINNWVLSSAIKQIAEWKQHEATRHLSLAININAQHFSTPGFAEALEQQLSEAGIDRSLLTLELTEGILERSIDSVRTQMQEVKKTGIRFSLDDFGTGNSSLSNLNKLPFDEIKIDGFFVSSIEEEAQNRNLIEGILGIAAAMNLETVAEHVSSSFQERYLRERGCTRFQGYHYYPPLPRAEFRELAHRRSCQTFLAS